jgi:hypothetical protein
MILLSGLRRSASGFYRFFSSFKWRYDGVARSLLRGAVKILGVRRIVLIVDDTMSPKTGRKIFGISRHCEKHKSGTRFFWGHNWVVVSLGVEVPLWKRWLSVPLLADLYIREVDCPRWRAPFRTKAQLAVSMVETLTEGLPSGVCVVTDGAYTNRSVLVPLKKRGMVVVGRLRYDTVLRESPPVPRRKRRGRKRKYGPKMPNLRRMRRWEMVERHMDMYSARVQVRTGSVVGYWGSAKGRVKVVKVQKRKEKPIYLLSTDVCMPDEEVVRLFSGRWSIETAFQTAKELMGMGQSQVRHRRSVCRMTNFGLWVQSIVLLTYIQAQGFACSGTIPIPRWYAHKETPSFGDMLGELRTALIRRGINRVCGARPALVRKILRCVVPTLRAA